VALLPAEAHRSYRKIHGMCKLPQGYSLTTLPSNAKIISDVSDRPGDIELCSSYNVPKAIVAIVQTIYASITLYTARGDQIQRYGYAAYGLTVLPYLIMSIMNLFAALLLPNYSTLYVVRSLELDEAIIDGGQVDGAVGRIIQSTIENDKFLKRHKPTVRPADQHGPGTSTMDTISNESQDENDNLDSFLLSITHVHSKTEVYCFGPILFEEFGTKRWGLGRKFLSSQLVSYVFGAIPIVVIGIWTRFDPGKSTTTQHVWTMFWLVADIFCGPIVDILSEKNNILQKILRRTGDCKAIKRWIEYVRSSIMVIIIIAALYLSIISLGKYFILLSIVLCTTPAIGGFVVVGQMLQAYGSCIEIS